MSSLSEKESCRLVETEAASQPSVIPQQPPMGPGQTELVGLMTYSEGENGACVVAVAGAASACPPSATSQGPAVCPGIWESQKETGTLQGGAAGAVLALPPTAASNEPVVEPSSIVKETEVQIASSSETLRGISIRNHGEEEENKKEAESRMFKRYVQFCKMMIGKHIFVAQDYLHELMASNDEVDDDMLLAFFQRVLEVENSGNIPAHPIPLPKKCVTEAAAQCVTETRLTVPNFLRAPETAAVECSPSVVPPLQIPPSPNGRAAPSPPKSKQSHDFLADYKEMDREAAIMRQQEKQAALLANEGEDELSLPSISHRAPNRPEAEKKDNDDNEKEFSGGEEEVASSCGGDTITPSFSPTTIIGQLVTAVDEPVHHDARSPFHPDNADNDDENGENQAGLSNEDPNRAGTSKVSPVIPLAKRSRKQKCPKRRCTPQQRQKRRNLSSSLQKTEPNSANSTESIPSAGRPNLNVVLTGLGLQRQPTPCAPPIRRQSTRLAAATRIASSLPSSSAVVGVSSLLPAATAVENEPSPGPVTPANPGGLCTCNACGKVFSRSDNLHKHRRNVHKLDINGQPVDPGIKWVCTRCTPNLELRCRDYLDDHIRTFHTNPGQIHRCKHCKKKFETQTGRNQHQKRCKKRPADLAKPK